MENNREKDFNSLVSDVQKCKKCPRMCGRTKVLSKENGNIYSKVMFVAEAPGRLGADCTGIPLHGDKTGDNFEELLISINWKREDVFITNAILCNPQNKDSINDKPKMCEIKNCINYLEKTIELVNPTVIVTLGKTALNALKLINHHNFILSKSLAKELSWNDKILFPLYHPSSKARIYRKKEEQMSDFANLKRIVSF